METTTHNKKRGRWAGLHHKDTVVPDITIVGLPYDGSICFRSGASGGPDRIRRLSTEIPPVLETGEILTRLLVRDDGDIPFGEDFVASFPGIETEIAKRIRQAFLLTLGGDHSVAIPVHRAYDQSTTNRIGLIFFDAHTDLSDRYQGSPYSNACPLRRTLEATSFSPENTILVGTRCFEPAGLDFIRAHHIQVFPAHEVAQRGPASVGAEIVKKLGHLSNVYLSIDIDVLDPAYAPGTGIPDGGGLSTRDLMTIIRTLDPLPVVGTDLVEVAPPLDISDITSFAALRIIMELFGLVHRRKARGERSTLC
ncbi:MAG: agmatinase [Nitrospiria bacterium]